MVTPTSSQWVADQVKMADNLSPDSLMIVEGAKGLDTTKLVSLFYTILTARGDFTDAQATDMSNHLGRLPHSRARAERAS